MLAGAFDARTLLVAGSGDRRGCRSRGVDAPSGLGAGALRGLGDGSVLDDAVPGRDVDPLVCNGRGTADGCRDFGGSKCGTGYQEHSGSAVDENFSKAARNIPNFDVLPSQGANVYDILKRHKLVLTKQAVSDLEERLS